MHLRRSGFVHLLDLPAGSVLALHAVTQMRVTVTPDVARVIRWFDTPASLEAAVPTLAALLGADADTIRACINLLQDRGILTSQTAEDETAAIVGDLNQTHGRDPTALLDQYRRSRMEGAHPYWSVEVPQALHQAADPARRIDVLVLGDCDVQMESGFLRQEAARRGIDLRVAASFAADTALAGERRHDLIMIGALQTRHAIVLGDPAHHGGDPAQVYVDDIRTMLRKLRAFSDAPILIDGLPEPTVQPLGFADRGIHSHRNRFRRTNLALAELAEAETDVHLVDVAAALASAGNAALLDDGLVSFTHFGAPGWMLQRPESELAAVHHQFPDRQVLADQIGGNPYGRETVMARAHLDAIVTVLGCDRKKCVIVDLDGVLWPGVLAETGSPFAWSPELGGPNSFVGLYFGIHEALRTLRRRGILLACVSKNDEVVVRNLWRYDTAYPRHRLLTLDDFVCTRINWDDKAANIRSIAAELGFALDAFMFIDDSPRERARIESSLPGVTVLGEDLFALRRILLTDPRLQVPRVTAEAANRSVLVKAQLDRARLRGEAEDDAAFLSSLNVVSHVERLTPEAGPVMDRVRELIGRTTQFNATGMTFTREELSRLAADPNACVFILHMRDRLADHGLVGATVVADGEILNVVMSCRVIGLGGEGALLAAVKQHAAAIGWSLTGRIVPTDRNLPARHLYRDHGFIDSGRAEAGQSLWTWEPDPLAEPVAEACIDA
ncbi:MAG TPA: HAD-IIIC family phosphatase [Rhodopila sp.]|nr:HAD-IIIC family phosphatase [Rhodopila sp.]